MTRRQGQSTESSRSHKPRGATDLKLSIQKEYADVPSNVRVLAGNVVYVYVVYQLRMRSWSTARARVNHTRARIIIIGWVDHGWGRHYMQAYRAIMASSSSFHCPLCSGVFLPSYRAWLSHLRHVHAHDPNFHITCGVDSCPSTFRKFTTLYSHVYRKHKQLLEPRERGSNNVVVDANDDQSASLCNDLDLSGKLLVISNINTSELLHL